MLETLCEAMTMPSGPERRRRLAPLEAFYKYFPKSCSKRARKSCILVRWPQAEEGMRHQKLMTIFKTIYDRGSVSRDQLAELPGRFAYRVLCGPTGCGKTRLLGALAEVGAQVLDLEGLASHRGSLIGDIPGVAQPTQKWFDSLLVDKLRRFDPTQSVWVESESKKIGAIQLPGELLEAMHAGRIFAISAPTEARTSVSGISSEAAN